MDKDHKIESVPQDVQKETEQEDSENVPKSEHSEREDIQEQSQELESLVIPRNPEEPSSAHNPVLSQMRIPSTAMGQGFVTQTTSMGPSPNLTLKSKANEEDKEDSHNISPRKRQGEKDYYSPPEDAYRSLWET